jgi:hypothetical protein
MSTLQGRRENNEDLRFQCKNFYAYISIIKLFYTVTEAEAKAKGEELYDLNPHVNVNGVNGHPEQHETQRDASLKFSAHA